MWHLKTFLKAEKSDNKTECIAKAVKGRKATPSSEGQKSSPKRSRNNNDELNKCLKDYMHTNGYTVRVQLCLLQFFKKETFFYQVSAESFLVAHTFWSRIRVRRKTNSTATEFISHGIVRIFEKAVF